MSYTICLNMIVKNESNVILNTLNNLTSKIKFDYWVISDTGSDDNTKEIITKFFKEKNIKGELIDTEWKDFGYNRSVALEAAYKKTDYLFIFDADDELFGNLIFPSKPEFDRYELLFGKGFTYYRPLFINNKKKWMFKGVLHEFLHSDEPHTSGQLHGDYYINSGRTGNRSQNKDKYLNDAKILSAAFDIEQDEMMKARYAFYCAQSYKDYKYNKEAIEWYLKCLDLNNWSQEKYYSCITLGSLYDEIDDGLNAQKYWLKSIKYDNERIEGIVSYIYRLRKENNHCMINLLYHKFKNYTKPTNKLFLNGFLYDDELEYENAISAFYVDDLKSGYECCKKILINNILSNDKLNVTLHNLMFYKDYIDDETIDECLKLYNIVDKLLSIEISSNKKNNKIWIQLYSKVQSLIADSTVNKFKIKIVNLEHRLDRKKSMFKLMANNHLENDYEFINAIDGKQLSSNIQLKKLFVNNNFRYMRGVIGCALSHLFLWQQLITDKDHDYYIILEDDINKVSENFKEKLNNLHESMINNELLFLGYHMWTVNRNNVSNIYDVESDNIIVNNIDKGLYIGGTFAYSINKAGAQKLINYIIKNGIKHPIDNLMLMVDDIDHKEIRPLITFSDWAERNKKVDSDIQYDHNGLYMNDITNDMIKNITIEEAISQLYYKDKFIFIKNLDHFGDDLYKRDQNINEMFKIAYDDSNCVGFNTMGYFKHTIKKLFKPHCFGPEDGIYIKKKLN